MLSEYSLRIADLYNIDTDILSNGKDIQFKVNLISEANYKVEQERQLTKCGIWHYDKLGYLKKPLRYLPFEEKYINKN